MTCLTIIVAALGTLSTLLCMALCVFFVRSRHQIGRAVGFDKLAEAVFAFITAFFAYFAQGVWNTPLSDELVALMRIVAFTLSIGASLHLTSSVMQIIRKDERDGHE